MTKEISVPANKRDSRGKNEARRLRAKGLTPAVMYGSGQEALALSVDPKQILKILHSRAGHNTIFNVAVQDGETTPVMIVDWQLDPVKENLLHVDLKRIDLTKRLRVSVPIRTQGDALGVKQSRAGCSKSSPARSRSSVCRTRSRSTSPSMLRS